MSLSTLKGAHELSDRFKKYQTEFFQAMQQRADKAGFRAWVIGSGNDKAKALELMELFKRHQIEFQALNAEINANGQVFRPGHAWVIPVNQRQFGLAQAMLESRTQFEDNTFYDVSAWSLAMAYDLPVAKLSRLPATSDGSPALTSNAPDPEAVAWIISWQQLNAAALLQDLHQAGANVRIATKPFSISDGPASISFSEGALVLLTGLQDKEKAAIIFDTLKNADVIVHSFNSQLTTTGPGLGTSHFKKAEAINPLLIVGQGTRSYDAGEAWFQLDQRLGVAPLMVDMSRLKSVDLHDYTHLLMVNGRYDDIGKRLKHDIASWVNDGGVLVTIQGAAEWAETLCFNGADCNEKYDEKEETGGPSKPCRQDGSR